MDRCMTSFLASSEVSPMTLAMTKNNKDRLPTNVAPVHYDLVIKTDVEQGTFEGKAVIR